MTQQTQNCAECHHPDHHRLDSTKRREAPCFAADSREPDGFCPCGNGPRVPRTSVEFVAVILGPEWDLDVCDACSYTIERLKDSGNPWKHRLPRARGDGAIAQAEWGRDVGLYLLATADHEPTPRAHTWEGNDDRD